MSVPHAHSWWNPHAVWMFDPDEPQGEFRFHQEVLRTRDGLVPYGLTHRFWATP